MKKKQGFYRNSKKPNMYLYIYKYKHFVIATYLVLRTLSLAVISELFVTFQLLVSVFYAVFYAMTSLPL